MTATNTSPAQRREVASRRLDDAAADAPRIAAPRRLYFLDGLRGWSALAVLFAHTFQDFLISPAAMAREKQSHVLAWINATPLGLAMDGTQAVFLFFVISGFSLSYPILISREPSRTLARQASFRYFRLTVPIVASCLLAYTLLSTGLLRNQIAGPLAASQWLSSLYRFDASFIKMIQFSAFDVYLYYVAPSSWNIVLWTMSIEFFGSFALFAGMIFWKNRRLQIMCALTACLLLRQDLYFGFPFGFLLALAFLRQNESPWRVGGLPMILLGLVLAVVMRTPYAELLMRVTHVRYPTYLNLIAGLIVAGVALSPWAQRVLSNKPSRFLGRISFPLYLVHVPIICSFGAAIYLALAPMLTFWFSVLVVGSVTVVACILASLVFEPLVEVQALRAVKWLLFRRTVATAMENDSAKALAPPAG